MEVDFLFQIGDNIVYPMHGAGIIEAIEEKEILGETKQYYIIRMSASNMQVMIPKDKISNSNIRPVTEINALKHIIHIFQHGESEKVPMKQRFKVNTDKIKTGKLQEAAEVVRDLMRIKKETSLNTSEKQLFDNAHKFLISELKLIKGITENQIKVFR
ncbi:CarD family transcriptional regulator [Pontibacillus sp. HMF3514]|uniref:CarD family transcriptional regulator n=1 Tax=Pontibacillus sp. HMF3514 TaxID=2692425 RepID=UPI00131FECDB|nr:CarD family transcriptional regulator [Pontibacillus sp. HMF3514]QHE51692.1 transcription factor YdeB [Pontibacillus sp. HMF3514]